MKRKLLEITNLNKYYPGTHALKDFTKSFKGGEVHALIGKNGSGKSTLVKILSGAIGPSSGSVFLNSRTLMFNNPQASITNGIATVYQELSLVQGLSVAENILIGRLPRKGKNRVDWKRANTEAENILSSLGINIQVKGRVAELSVGNQQIIEIAKAMSICPSVMILDEPTSALAKHETECLFNVINEMKKKGVIIIYITHRLQELHQIADTVTVLRDGELTGSIPAEMATSARLVDMMFGETVQKKRPQYLSVENEVVMEVVKLSAMDKFRDISFSLRKGEILGIAGLLGSGRTELLRAIFGRDNYDGGYIKIRNEILRKVSIQKMKKFGIGFTSEDRKKEGLVLCRSTKENLCLANLKGMSRCGIISKKMEKSMVHRQLDQLQIKVNDIDSPVNTLSGGNQQKVVVGNWLNSDPTIMLFDEPSRGIDVQAKQQIFKIIWNLSKTGVSSIFISSELEELLEVCHRIIIMRHGELITEKRPEELKLNELYALCMGEELN